MSADGSITIAGVLTKVSSKREEDIGLSQSIDTIEPKSYDITIPPGGGSTSIPLVLSGGITEALFLQLYSSARLVLSVTGKDAGTPGPAKLGILGLWIMTMYPGEGVVTLSAANPDPVNPVTLKVLIGALGASTDSPVYYQ